MKIIFFLGSHRTGTKLIANFFHEHYPDVESHHQFNALRFVNVLTHMYAGKVISPATYEFFIKKLLVNRIKKSSQPVYIESNGFNYIAAHFAKKYFSDVRIVHLVRDPRDFVTSYINWTHERWKSRVAHQFVPFWNANGYRAGEFGREEWKAMDTFARHCWYWRFKNEKIINLYQQESGAYYALRLEDLVAASYRTDCLKALLEFMGLKYLEGSDAYFKRKQNESTGTFFPKWEDWTPAQCQTLQALCGDLMQTFEYGQEQEWLKKVK